MASRRGLRAMPRHEPTTATDGRRHVKTAPVTLTACRAARCARPRRGRQLRLRRRLAAARVCRLGARGAGAGARALKRQATGQPSAPQRGTHAMGVGECFTGRAGCSAPAALAASLLVTLAVFGGSLAAHVLLPAVEVRATGCRRA